MSSTGTEPYADLLDMEYPRPSLRERMPMSERAKIFMPFAALKGFDALLAERAAQWQAAHDAPAEQAP